MKQLFKSRQHNETQFFKKVLCDKVNFAWLILSIFLYSFLMVSVVNILKKTRIPVFSDLLWTVLGSETYYMYVHIGWIE